MKCSEDPYLFNIGDVIYLQSCVGIENTPCEVLTRYTSDEFTHEASPHRRYTVTVQHPKGDIVSDFSEIEFSKEVFSYECR